MNPKEYVDCIRIVCRAFFRMILINWRHNLRQPDVHRANLRLCPLQTAASKKFSTVTDKP